MVSDELIVSVVIPTVKRPELVMRAVRSALAQTLKPIEVIVVIDGPDEATRKALAAVDEPRLLVKALPRNGGLGAARNAGVDAARSRWIAFLDDDDEWFPRKLDIQLRTAQQSLFQDPIISCRFIKRSETTDVLLPRRLPSHGESMSDYLFRRTRLFGGEGLIQPSTILTTRNLLQKVPFRAELRRPEDLDWLLRTASSNATTVEFVSTSEPLAVWHREGQRESMSGRKDWRFSFSWIQQNRHLVSSQAYASFLLTWLSANAIKQGDRSAFWPLLKEACRGGTPSLLDRIVFVGIWLIPQAWRRWAACCVSAARN